MFRNDYITVIHITFNQSKKPLNLLLLRELQRCYVKQEELQKEEKMYVTDGGKNLIKYYCCTVQSKPRIHSFKECEKPRFLKTGN
jgi:hypothetical protein